MSNESYELPAEESLRCTLCGKTTACTREELQSYIADDAKWPHCCGVRMAVDFPVEPQTAGEGVSL